MPAPFSRRAIASAGDWLVRNEQSEVIASYSVRHTENANEQEIGRMQQSVLGRGTVRCNVVGETVQTFYKGGSGYSQIMSFCATFHEGVQIP